MTDFEKIFIDAPHPVASPVIKSAEEWKVMIVDDEQDILFSLKTLVASYDL